MIKNIILQNSSENYGNLFKKTQKRFIIIGLDGKILFDSMEDKFIDSIKNYHSRPEILSALKNNEGLSTRKSEITKKEMMYFALKLNSSQIIRVSVTSNNALKHIKLSTYVHIILFSLLNLFALISYQFYLKRYLFDRIDQIKKMLEDGNEIKEVVTKGDKWLFKFWEVIKEWQDNNLKNIEKLKLEKIKLNNIISSVDMGIILVDSEKKIKLKNNAINFIYIKKDIDNYENDIKYPEIIKFIDRLISKKENNISEIYLDDIQKYVLLRGKYMKSRKEYLFTIKDITRNRETMEVQKNFITNVGHELKTPLTNIMGYLVALREEDDPLKRDKFINTIERNAGKLDNILMDFLNLSKIESSKVINLAPIHVNFLKDEINRSLENQIESKKVDLSYKLDLQTDYIRIDFEKTTMILKNLIENAIIYNINTPKIKITMEEKFDKYKISVKDNGIGMNKSDTYKIFDRFYRVDKARTSNVAGTGLGLSIVYELVHLCGGDIDVKSNKKGTLFTFTMIK
ncbi:HAMP domain-containing sensor histidine kinase [Psychrilyobacter sp.]|uniref:sensor histidine kinase n=1 Tax=Psychrilyobacter sp. TaxID=2586924 RepID=UPI00301808F4